MGNSNHYTVHRERLLAQRKATRDAIVAAGGPALDELRRKERERRATYRKNYPDKIRAKERGRGQSRPFKTSLCASARFRGRKKGLPATIMPGDLVWPSHCPVLGIELDYPARSGDRKNLTAQANWPSLDRWDSAKGYIPGNVFVISYRANTLKNNVKPSEILMIAKYVMRKPTFTASTTGALLDV